MQIVFIVCGVLVVIAGLAGFAHWTDRKRRDAFQQVADELGLTFHPDGSDELLTRLAGFALFNSGRARRLTKLIQGASDEVSISIFDYQYTTGSGKHSQTHRQSVAALHSNELRVPAFTLRAEHIWDKLGGMIGMPDIDFDSHPQFSGMFVLKGDNEAAIRKFFNPAILSFFEAHKGISVEAVPGALIFYRPGRKVAPSDLKDLLSQAYEVYGVMVDNQ